MPTREEERTRSKVVNLTEHAAYTDVDEALVREQEKVETAQQTHGIGPKSAKLRHANEVGAKSTAEIKTLVAGLNNKVAELGVRVAEAEHYQGVEERMFAFFGRVGFQGAKERADSMKHDRIQSMSLEDAVKEIHIYVQNVIKIIGESESKYKNDLIEYDKDIALILKKYKDANPGYLEAKAQREKLEAEVVEAEEELKAGTLEESEKPAKEKHFDDIKRQLAESRLQESTLLAVVQKAQEALPGVQAVRDSANDAIQSLHGMRQGMKEKFDNFESVLKNAATAMQARARMELFEAVDPALNTTIEAVVRNNVATAGAAQEVYTDRARIAAINPEKFAEISKEFMDNLADFQTKLAGIEANTKTGARALAAHATPGNGTAQPEEE